MKTKGHKHLRPGFTLLELVIVVGIIVVMVGLLIPALGRPRARSAKMSCVNHLKQIGLALRIFANEHEDLFPWAVSTSEGGAFISANERPSNATVFRTIANEVSTPKILVCPEDKGRVRASHFDLNSKDVAGLFRSDANVSYYLHFAPDETKTNYFLTGDRNLTGGTPLLRGAVETRRFARASGTRLTNDASIGFNDTIHRKAGNLGFADGSVQRVSSAGFRAGLDSMLDTSRGDAVDIQLPTDLTGSP